MARLVFDIGSIPLVYDARRSEAVAIIAQPKYAVRAAISAGFDPCAVTRLKAPRRALLHCKVCGELSIIARGGVPGVVTRCAIDATKRIKLGGAVLRACARCMPRQHQEQQQLALLLLHFTRGVPLQA